MIAKPIVRPIKALDINKNMTNLEKIVVLTKILKRPEDLIFTLFMALF